MTGKIKVFFLLFCIIVGETKKEVPDEIEDSIKGNNIFEEEAHVQTNEQISENQDHGPFIEQCQDLTDVKTGNNLFLTTESNKYAPVEEQPTQYLENESKKMSSYDVQMFEENQTFYQKKVTQEVYNGAEEEFHKNDSEQQLLYGTQTDFC
ncbi:uncharacterized protein LOC126835963 isoform X1 [Adelges cooleyi]|uniref:uncharacterized protein LOC126835963 isoform X1 n=1 Tax=Adelges cooleyi TaxID=133065 RepID=UPI00218017DA|nr:uncharacterized protein LOC126835963 isoform X1 [Adelges cooleyi]